MARVARRVSRVAIAGALAALLQQAAVVPAAAVVGGSTLVAAAKPALIVGQTNGIAGNWALTPNSPTGNWTPGEVLTIAIDDADGAANCGGAGDVVAFSVPPTVTLSGTATMAVSTASTAACAALIPPRRDQLVVTFTGAGTGTLGVTSVRYDIGTAVSSGDVAVTATDSDATPVTVAAAANALLTGVVLTANNPPVGLRTGSGVQAISNVVITEQVTDSIGAVVCLELSGGDTFDATAPSPSVAVGGFTGDSAMVAVATGGTGLQVNVTDSATDTTPATFTIGNIRLGDSATNNAGPVAAVLRSGACTPVPPVVVPLSVPTVLAGIVTTDRFGGSDRFTTAQILLEDAFPCVGNGLANVVVARSDDFPDALAASYLAGKLGTGIVLVDPSSPTLPPATANTLRLRGVDRVVIVGGPVAVPAALATALDNQPNVNCAGAPEAAPNDTMAVLRIEGADRFETARRIAEFPGLAAAGTADYDGTDADPDGPGCNARRTAIVAIGDNFPDALVAGPVAFNGHNVPGVGTPALPGCGNGEGFPVILTTGSALHPQASVALANLGIAQVLVMGGNAVITPAVESSLQGLGILTRRFAGANRLDTARQFGDFAIDFLGYSRTAVAVARGDDFPDALAGGPHAGLAAAATQTRPAKAAGVIVLTESLSSAGTETLAFLRQRQGSVGVFGATAPLSPVTDVDVYGGTSAVSDAVVAILLGAVSQAV